jgi:hypothetical protein
MPLATADQLGAPCLDALEALDDACRRLVYAGALRIDTARFDALCATQIADELSRHATETNGRPAYDALRDAAEQGAANAFADALPAALAGPKALARWLLDVAAAAGVAEPRLRSGPVGLDPDGAGRMVAFADAREIPGRLQALCERLRLSSRLLCFDALVLQAGLLNLHPLRDGNGRAARLAYTAMLRWRYPGLVAHPPVYRLRSAAPFAFEIALRSAELHGEWRRLARFHAAVIDAMLACREPSAP